MSSSPHLSPASQGHTPSCLTSTQPSASATLPEALCYAASKKVDSPVATKGDSIPTCSTD